ncbi:MAG: NAD-dependent epimerase/dehydratase family protein [Magnetococcales bacterium]|nr:NAD-dependent epimerase/dehydratase family protein [Magnetococcales bacterium]
MRVLILGGDGYLGWPTAMHLSKKGYDVAIIDNYFRRNACRELNREPLLPALNLHERVAEWQRVSGKKIEVAIGDITHYPFLKSCFSGVAFTGNNDKAKYPDAVIHYAEQPSGPYSMMDYEKSSFTITNNLMSTLNLIHAIKEYKPECHIIKLGTMGVYGTPNIDIEEGYIEIEKGGRKHTCLFPKSPGSLYHLTKVQDGDMLYFYCKTWGIKVTDLNQGPVYGMFTDETQNNENLATIFNYDDIFGTVLNRFIVQAVCGYPLTVYGKGGQVRGYLNIKDTLQCVELTLRTPASEGEYRVLNQFTETFTVNDLAKKVQDSGRRLGLDVKIKAIANPRVEAEDHYYNPKHTGLMELGLQANLLSGDVLDEMIGFVKKYKSSVNTNCIKPQVKWN